LKYTLKFTSKFKKDYKFLTQKQKVPKEEFAIVFYMLENDIKLPPRYKEHMLKGQYLGCHECHIRPDLLLIWKYYKNELIISMIRTGSHSKLFNK